MKRNLPDILHPTSLWYLVEIGNNKSSSYRRALRVQGLERAKDYATTDLKQAFKIRIKEEASGKVVWRSF